MSRDQTIKNLLEQHLHPLVLEVTNESFMHRVAKDAETHYKLIAVSKNFLNLKIIDRHKLVNKLLEQEFQRGLHALSMQLYTPEEWEQNKGKKTKTPNCRGGFGN